MNRDLLHQFDLIKTSEEEILWVGRPNKSPLILKALMKLLWGVLFIVFWVLGTQNFNVAAGSESPSYFMWFGVLSGIGALYYSCKELLEIPNLTYAYSSKRVIIRGGAFGTDFKTIDFAKIKEMEVKVDFISKLYGLGEIRFFSGQVDTNVRERSRKVYDTWSGLEEPYEVFKNLKEYYDLDRPSRPKVKTVYKVVNRPKKPQKKPVS